MVAVLSFGGTALALVLAAQDPMPKLGADPSGVVVDEQGRSIAGATVELRASTDRTGAFACGIAQVVMAWPLVCDDEVARLTVPRISTLLVRCERLPENIASFGVTAVPRGFSYVSATQIPHGSRELLIRCFGRDDQSFWMTLAGRAPVFIRTCDLGEEDPGNPLDVHVLDRSRPRRIPVRFVGEVTTAPKNLYFLPKGLPIGRSGDGAITSSTMAEKDADGSWCFVALDRGAYECQVVCDGFADTTLTVPTAENGVADVALELRLVPKQ